MENRRLISGLQWLPLLLPVTLAILAVGDVVRLWMARWSHPYDLEWMEGGMLAHAWRVAHGDPLFVAPGPDFIPYIYPPGYPELLALLSQWIPLGYPLGRGVSLFGTLLAASAILAFVLRHRAQWMGGWIAGLMGAAVFVLCYPDSGAFYDLVRPDGMALGLTAWALVLGLERQRKWVALGALLLVAAFLMKQHSAIFGLPILFALACRDGRGRALWFAVWSVIPALMALLWLQVVSNGHYLTYILSVPATHGVKGQRIFPGLAMEMGAALPITMVVGALGFGLLVCVRWVRGGGLAFLGLATTGLLAAGASFYLGPVSGLKMGTQYETAAGFAGVAISVCVVLFWLAQVPKRKRLNWRWVFGISMVTVTALMVTAMRGHHGGYVNVYMPLHWCASLGLAIATCQCLTWSKDGEGDRWLGPLLIATVLGGILAHGWFDLPDKKLRPTQADVEAGDRWVAALKTRKGPVLSPFAPWLPVQAGHAPSFHLISLSDVDDLGHPRSPYPGIRSAIEGHMAAGYWGTIVDTRASMGRGVKKHYQIQRTLSYGGPEFYPKTGWRQRPEVIRGPNLGLTAGPIQLPQWQESSVQESPNDALVLKLDGRHIWSSEQLEPVTDLNAVLGNQSERPVRIQARRDGRLGQLERVLVHCARNGTQAVYLDVLTTTGRGTVQLPTIPKTGDHPVVRLLLGESRMEAVRASDGQRITLTLSGPSELPSSVIWAPVVPAKGTVQEAVQQLERAWSHGWPQAYLGFNWPESIGTALSTDEEVQSFWTGVTDSVPQSHETP